MVSPLISVAELREAIDSENPPKILDVRWKLGGPPGASEYARGHIPTAVYVDLDSELAKHGAPIDGRHPIPDRADLESAAQRWGLNNGDSVVVYDDAFGMSAARAWWLLRYAGVNDVRVLDGGYAAWLARAAPLSTDDVRPARGNILLRYGSLLTVDADGAARVARAGVLLDARAAERYRGEIEPIDPRAGHIPGATSAPTAENLDAAGLMLAPELLAARFSNLGITDQTRVGVYCGSGVTAAHEALAMVVAGLPMPALYPGSFSAWSNDPVREVVRAG